MRKLALYTLVLASIPLVLVACGGGAQQPTSEAPAEAYETFKQIIEAQDLEAYKAMMSSKLKERLQGDFLINDAMKSAQSKGWFEKVPMGEPELGEGTATFSKTHDEGTMMATYSIVFVEEDGVWKFEMLKTSTKAK